MTGPDVMCKGDNCLLKSVCFRFNATPSKDQIYLEHSPMKVTWNDKGLLAGRTFHCPEFWVLTDNKPAWRALSHRLHKEDQAALIKQKGAQL
jgi:hypothetical protein